MKPSTVFVPLPASAPLPNCCGVLEVSRGPDGKPVYQRTLLRSGRTEALTHEEAVRHSTHTATGSISKRLYPLLFPPPLTRHHLAREQFDRAMFLAEDGAFNYAADLIQKIADDYRSAS